ncbi:hypothetical protein A2693_02665 [Candidatus Curtissbacteria bacterium RIFCSPHIGHO2_01_FULL_40_12]|uniref:Glycosyltransferase 2-like domain-containing protein n=1 Tax=Candidatus Curtissbacteria bacterium RIFCSPHIGHO2_01_FULL_40_12 TaxID=1797710 RepID=A0A1F5G868_9BACT|nr:MAG: hypothetical protein A2693_02665 [Candidatus Curtissbacteria bacterium RIFCSPHIGHO2_01_FULL_40_12]
MSSKALPAGRQARVSVIMSVYNGMPFLKDAVESILNQTYENFEFIIVDDASTDDTWQYLKSLKDRRVRLLKNKNNLGLASSLNVALRQAQGDYVARMDADDISLPKRFEKQIEFLLKNPSIDLCGTWADLIDENGKIIGEKKFPKRHLAIIRALLLLSPIIHPTFFAKSEVFKELKGYNPRFEYAEDYEFLLRAKEKFRFENITQKLFQWRLWDERRSRAQMEKIDQADFKVKWTAFERGYFGKSYLIIVFLKFLVTFVTPYFIKKAIAKKVKLA